MEFLRKGYSGFTSTFAWLVLLAGLTTPCVGQTPIVELQRRLEQHPSPDTARVNLLTTLSARLLNSEPKATLGYAQEAEKLSGKLGYIKGLAASNEYIASYYARVNNNKLAMHYFKQALPLYQQIGNKEKEALSLYVIGAVYAETDSTYSTGLAILFDALKLCELHSFKQMKGRVLNEVAVTYAKQEDWSRAIAFYQQAVDLTAQSDTLSQTGKYYYGRQLLFLGNAHYQLKHVPEGLKCASEGFRLVSGINPPALNLQAYAYELFGNLYEEEKKFKEAMTFYAKSLDLNTQLNAIYQVGSCHLSIGKLLLQQDKFEGALENLNKAQGIFHSLHDNHAESLTYEQLYRLYKKTNNYKESLFLLERYKALADTIHKTEKAAKIAQVEGLYKTELKDLRIKELDEQQRAKENQLRQQRIIIGVVSVSLIIVVAVGIFAQRQRTRAILELKKNIGLTNLIQKNLEEKLKDSQIMAKQAQMNPHFIFNSISSIQNLILKENKAEAVTYLNAFSKLTRQALENSDKKFISIKEEHDFLEHYLQLESLRANHQFDYAIKIAADIDPIYEQLPPMLVQPFVENAIRHGITDLTDRKGHVTISFDRKDNHFLLCTIEDNGMGRRATSYTTKEKNHTSIGAALSESRVELLHNREQASHYPNIIFEDKVDDLKNPMGTKVIIQIPT
jgi:two-component system, LytTR family, sensor kinase